MRLKRRKQRWRPPKVEAQPKEPKLTHVPDLWSDMDYVSLEDLEYLPCPVGVENKSQMAYDKLICSHDIALIKYGLNKIRYLYAHKCMTPR